MSRRQRAWRTPPLLVAALSVLGLTGAEAAKIVAGFEEQPTALQVSCLLAAMALTAALAAASLKRSKKTTAI
ncbi:hypothetical protein O7635_24400 [Asanoa sp. WMMD1127]|uniref:hypothetical protein n=1 Tax=Asanoa sp. WMMD1127 TaxID=3016107 RepID=UPI0024161E4F|nr:hypothetical protein [Asanoa sp. WMMD1127]MDG4825002.1 hypothetical protein [Asanoa sp. WMMD1127]